MMKKFIEFIICILCFIVLSSLEGNNCFNLQCFISFTWLASVFGWEIIKDHVNVVIGENSESREELK